MEYNLKKKKASDICIHRLLFLLFTSLIILLRFVLIR